MLKNFKYSFAIVKENGIVKRIYHTQLEDEGIRIKYRGKELYDETDSFRLFIRYRPGSSHFYARFKNRKNLSSGVRETEDHSNAIKLFFSLLSECKSKKIQIGCYDWYYTGDNSNKFDLEQLYTIENYLWGTEIKRDIGQDGFVYHDILGQPANLRLTDKEPLIIIEVIDTHFPDCNVFNLLRDYSKQIPIIIILYFVKYIPKMNYFKVKGLPNPRLIVKYYIDNGSFWIGTERIEEKDYSYIKTYKTPVNFDDPEQYYKAVLELEIKKVMNNH